MAAVQRCWPSGQTDSGRHNREQEERREWKIETTDSALITQTQYKTWSFSGSTLTHIAWKHTYELFLLHAANCKTCNIMQAEHHILFHFVSRAGEKAIRWAVSTGPIFLFPAAGRVSLGIYFCSALKGDHCFAEFETFEVSEVRHPSSRWNE